MTTSDKDPISIGRVTLTVHDLPRVSEYYQRVVGLGLLNSEGETATLGAGGRPLLELRQDKSARFRSPREAGLFHTAFLLPSRADLGRWVKYAIDKQIPVQGASDHIVSEAAYLADPEGNGIEIYSDRPRDSWIWKNGEVKMATEAMDVAGVVASGDGIWAGAPAGTVVGHVHLQVGDVDKAQAFYHDKLGFDITTHYPGAAFFATGGYHHHLAANVWNSRGAGPRQMPSTGLTGVELVVRDAATAATLTESFGSTGIADPWGTPINLKVA